MEVSFNGIWVVVLIAIIVLFDSRALRMVGVVAVVLAEVGVAGEEAFSALAI